LYAANLLMAFRGFRYLPPLNVLWSLARHDTTLVHRGLANGLLRFFGEISYGMYLYHLLVVMAYTRGFERLHPEVPFLLQWAGLLGVSSAVSYVSWRLFEEPILRWKARFEYAEATPRQAPASPPGKTAR
jgi:peptidoglycan/LPS O-acetylase OafA/YrhL